MPNWCMNRLSILGEPGLLEKFVEKARGPTQKYANPEDERHEEAFSFHRLRPIPPEIEALPYDPHGHDAERRLWGVKWGASNSKLVRRESGRVDYEFVTPWGPWGPARTLFEFLSKEWDLAFVCSWAEEYPSRGYFILRRGKYVELVKELPGRERPSAELDEEELDEWWKTWRQHYFDRHEGIVRSGEREYGNPQRR